MVKEQEGLMEQSGDGMMLEGVIIGDPEDDTSMSKDAVSLLDDSFLKKLVEAAVTNQPVKRSKKAVGKLLFGD